VPAIGAVVVAALVIPSMNSINRSGGWGWLLIGGLYIAGATLACLGAAICSAISLYRGEARRRLATVILLCCCAEVWVFRGSLTLVLRGLEPDPNAAIIAAEADLASALARHFALANIVLKPGDRNGGFQENWFLDSADAGPRCEVRVNIHHFPAGAPVEMMRKSIEFTTPPPVLNEQAGLAMSRPIANARSANPADCDAWSGKSTEFGERLRTAFRSFRPPPVRERR
jgi:hypothetical protein